MTSSTGESHDMDQISSLFSGVKLNASQAARVAGVQRPVVATWASRHRDSGFPAALIQDDASRETYYDALDFVVWASKRRQAKRSFEQMLVLAAVEGSVAPAIEKRVELRRLVQSLMVLTLAYRVVDPVLSERPVALLRRYAAASPMTVKNLEPLLLKVTPGDVELLRCPAYVLARFSDDVLGGVQLFSSLLMGRQKVGEQISADLGAFLKSMSARFSGDMRLHLASGVDSALTVQIAQNLSLSQDARRDLLITSANSGGEESSFARALSVLADEELLLLPEQAKEPTESSFLLMVLPLAKSVVSEEQQWSGIEDFILDAPPSVPVFVLGRAEVLGAAFESEKNEPRQSVIEAGHLLALVGCGQRQLVTESGARLMVGVFENHRILSAEKTPLVALIDLSEKLDAFHAEAQEAALHDVESLTFESRQTAVYSASGEHRVVSGPRVPWVDIKEQGFDSVLESSARVSGLSQTAQNIERDVERINTAEYNPFSVRWKVSSVSGASQRSLSWARSEGRLRRIAGMTAQKVSELIEGSSGSGVVRIVDSAAMEHFRVQGVLPEVYDSLSTLLAGQGVEFARPGDLLVCEGANPVVFGVREDLVVAQAPVFILRRHLPKGVAADFRLDAFVGLVQTGLDTQIEGGAAKASWAKARISLELLNAVLSDVSNEQVDQLDRQLGKVQAQKRFLREQLAALEFLERKTLRGLVAGTIKFSE